jgi:hypothetical protein
MKDILKSIFTVLISASIAVTGISAFASSSSSVTSSSNNILVPINYVGSEGTKTPISNVIDVNSLSTENLLKCTSVSGRCSNNPCDIDSTSCETANTRCVLLMLNGGIKQSCIVTKCPFYGLSFDYSNKIWNCIWQFNLPKDGRTCPSNEIVYFDYIINKLICAKASEFVDIPPVSQSAPVIPVKVITDTKDVSQGVATETSSYQSAKPTLLTRTGGQD